VRGDQRKGAVCWPSVAGRKRGKELWHFAKGPKAADMERRAREKRKNVGIKRFESKSDG